MAINLSIKKYLLLAAGLLFLWCGKGGGDSYLYMDFFPPRLPSWGNCYR